MSRHGHLICDSVEGRHCEDLVIKPTYLKIVVSYSCLSNEQQRILDSVASVVCDAAPLQQ